MGERDSILLIDDDRTTSRLMRHNLESKSTRVIEATTDFDGIRILSEARVDLVLMDFGLPHFNGWGILSLLRLTEPLRHIPVIIISVEPPDTALVEQLRPDDYIQKPFDIHDLLMRVKKVIASKSVTQHLTNKVTRLGYR